MNGLTGGLPPITRVIQHIDVVAMTLATWAMDACRSLLSRAQEPEGSGS
jgi:hypothetical protein